MNDVRSISDGVKDTLAEIGITTDSLVRPILIQDGYFLGQKYAYDGGYVIWLANSDTVEVYSDDGVLLKMAAFEDATDTAA